MNNTTEFANNIYEQPWWLDTVAPGNWEELLSMDENGNVLARMVTVKSGKSIYMPLLTQTLGFWMREDIRGNYGEEKRILNEFISKIKTHKKILIRLDPENHYVLPFKWADFVIEPRFTYRINDLSNPDAIYAGFNKTAKKNIKSAKNKVHITDSYDFDELWEMLNKTFLAQKRKNPMSKDLVYKITEACEKQGAGKYLCAKDDSGNVHSCAYFVYDKNVCYYLIGATDSAYRSSGAQSLIIWEGIKFAAEHSKVFDFEGSSIESIENFFRQFNNTCTVYYEVRKQPAIRELLNLIKPKIKRMIGYKV